MNHPTAEQLDRYRRRRASPAETIEIDAHVATCDRCFAAVRADAHLTYDELEAIADGREANAPHLALCAACRGELADLRAMREALREERTPRNRWWLAAAAMLAVAMLAAWLVIPRRPGGAAPASGAEAPVAEAATAPQETKTAVVLERPAILDTLLTEASILRGAGATGAFALQAPVATVVLDERPRFRWSALAGATSYDVAVVDLNGVLVANGTSTTTSWQPDAPLPRGKTYAWQVAASTPDGRVVAPGRNAPEARFHVATESSVEGATPRERGIALARLGALDAAERELAHEPELLAQVRAWRGQRALPITTNGAQ